MKCLLVINDYNFYNYKENSFVVIKLDILNIFFY